MRVEFSQGPGLDFKSDVPREQKVAVSDSSASRILANDRKTGFTNGAVTEAFTTFNLVPGLSSFWLRAMLDFDSKYLDFKKINVSQTGELLRLTGRGRNDARKIEWKIDPAKSFSFVAQTEEVEHPWGKNLTTRSYDLFEPKPGIWLPRRIVIDHRVNGEVAQHIIAELIADTVKINEDIPKTVFDLAFPSGTEVMNTNQKTSYIEGGGTSRSRESVAKLASEAKQLDAAGPISVPSVVSPNAGALTSESSSRSTILWIGGVSFFLLIGGILGWQRWGTRQ